MKLYKLITTLSLILLVLISPILETGQNVLAAGDECSTSSPSSGNYSIEICITSPTNGSTLSGDVNITTSFSTSGSAPGIQRMVFYLNNEYLLTDFENEYSFLLPTQKFADGTYVLSVVVVMRDGYVFQMGKITVIFNNGNASAPINTNTFQPFTSPPPSNGEPFMVAAGGDGASGITNSANVTNLINNLDPDMFLYLGDVYNKGTYTEFLNWYGDDQTFFGQFKSITNPIVGNHEYENGVAPGYFDYWDNVPDYYSYDAGGWHFVALNSNHSVLPVTPGSAQFQWLQSDLSANSDKCTVVYFHHPLFNIGPPSSTTELMDIWNLLVQAGVEIALTGHDHTYQRWSPLGIDGQPDPNGVTQFVAGASGHGVQTISKTDDRVAFFTDANPGALGVLMLALNSSGANFSYVNTAGDILDAGVIPCNSNVPDTSPPTIPGNMSANIISSTQVEVNWNNSTDNTGVAGYTVFRNGEEIANTTSGVITFLDSNLLPENTYSYAVEAFDLAGNRSGLSELITVTTPPLPGTLIFPVVADSYVSSVNTSANYGSASTLRMDGSPVVNSFLMFNINGLAGNQISSARLKLYSNTNSSIGFQVKEVIDSSWSEYSVNYNNAPALGNIITTSGPISSGGWLELDVSSYIIEEGIYSFGLDTTSSSGMSLGSRESGTNAPVMIIDLQTNNADQTPPTTPSDFSAIVDDTGSVSLSWAASTDNIGVTGYTIYRDDVALITLSETDLSYLDTTVNQGTTYNYTIDSFDLAGNRSEKSNVLQVEILDNQAPSTPTEFIATSISSTEVALSWSLASDNVRIAGYNIYRDGVILSTIDSTQSSYTDFSITPNVEYIYTLDAFDNAGNHSAPSDPVIVNIPDLPQTLTLVPIADSYVDASKSTINYGTATTLRVDASPDLHAYIKFYIPDLGEKSISNAQLFVHANSNARRGLQLFEVLDNNWNENSIDFNTAPILGNLISSVASVNSGEWAVFDVTSHLSTTGEFTFGMNTSSSTSVSLASRENSTFSPYLILDLFEEIPDTIPPSVPTDLSATPINSNLIELNWTQSIDDVGVAGYTIYRDGLLLDTISGSSTSFSDMRVVANTDYSYAIDAFDQTGNYSDISPSISVTTPDLPKEVTILPSADSYVNSSNPSSNYGSSSILRTDGSPDLHSFLQFNVNNLGEKLISKAQLFVFASSRTNKGLNIWSVNDNGWQEDMITYQNAPALGDLLGFVSSGNTGVWLSLDVTSFITGEGVYSMGISTPGTTAISLRSREYDLYSPYLLLDLQSYVPDTEAPSTPTELTATLASPTQIDLNWSAATDNTEVTGYTIYRDGAPISSVSGSELSFSDLDLSPSFTYTYSISAFDAQGNFSALSNEVMISTPENEPPSTPEILSAEDNGPTHVVISWSPSTDNIGVTGYTLYRDGSILSVVDGETLTLSDYSVTTGQTYQYSIDAFDAAGNHSPSSTPVSVTVTTEDLESPSIPPNLTATIISPTQIDLNWNASSDNVGVVGYILYRDGLSIGDFSSSNLSFQDINLLPNTTYSYAVESYDQAGNHSGLSETVSVTTPDLPTSIVFETIADSYVNESLLDSNFGTATSMRVDGSPILNSFLKFSIAGLYGKTISNVQLMVYANSGSGNGMEVHAISDNQWSEQTINFTNAPLLENVIATTPSVTANNWISFDITNYITGEGDYSLGLSTPGATAISLASRETGNLVPYLIIELD